MDLLKIAKDEAAKQKRKADAERLHAEADSLERGAKLKRMWYKTLDALQQFNGVPSQYWKETLSVHTGRVPGGDPGIVIESKGEGHPRPIAEVWGEIVYDKGGWNGDYDDEPRTYPCIYIKWNKGGYRQSCSGEEYLDDFLVEIAKQLSKEMK